MSVSNSNFMIEKIESYTDHFFPKVLVPTIYEYAKPNDKELTELFLQLFLVDHFKYQGQKKVTMDKSVWTYDTTHLDLSKIRFTFIDPDRPMKVASILYKPGYFEFFLRNAIQRYFPRLESISLPTFVHDDPEKIDPKKLKLLIDVTHPPRTFPASHFPYECTVHFDWSEDPFSYKVMASGKPDISDFGPHNGESYRANSEYIRQRYDTLFRFALQPPKMTIEEID